MEGENLPGAVITSKNRKVQLEFNDGRAQTAGKVTPSAHAFKKGTHLGLSSGARSSTAHRPNTIEGVTPAPPVGDKPPRSFRTLSPRELSLIAQPTTSLVLGEKSSSLVVGGSAEGAQESSSSWGKDVATRPATAAAVSSGRVAVQVSKREKHQSHDGKPSSVSGGAGFESNSRPGTSFASWQRVSVEGMMPNFLRPSTASATQNNAILNPFNSINPGGGESITPRQSLPAPDANEEDLQRKNVLLDRLKAKPAFPVRSQSSNSTLHGRRSGEIGGSPQQRSQMFRENLRQRQLNRGNRGSKFDANKLRRLQETDSSVGETDFQSMELDDVIRYLWDASNGDSSKSTFVHVACRRDVERVFRESFYDLVALERPGVPSSGYVWTRDVGKYAFNNHVLPKHKIMQLSLNGLLVAQEHDLETELIPIDDLLLERDQFEFLRTGCFFGMFKELKAFSAWKAYTHHNYVQRMKRQLMRNTCFSDSELIAAMLLVVRAVYEIEHVTELFQFVGKGIVYVEDFLAKQMTRIEEVRRVLQQKIQAIGDGIAAKHHEYMNSQKLKDLIQEVKDFHPLRDVIEETEGSIDWVQLRSVQRLGENFKEKVRAILYMAQFRIENALASIVEKFWLRMKQSLLGVHIVRGDRKTSNLVAWDLDRQLFDATTGKVLESAYSANENLVSFDAVEAYAAVHGEGMSEDERKALEASLGIASTSEEKALLALKAKKNAHFAHQKKISTDFERQGVHLCLLVKLHLGDRPLEAADLVYMRTIERIKVQIVPPKNALMNQIHLVCGQIGKLFETLPNLKQHSLIVEHAYKTSYVDAELELGLGDLANVNSSVYFTFLVLFPSYNSRHAYSSAIETMRLLLAAHQEACAVDFYTFKLTEIFRKLWSLSPTMLVKQMDRSLALPKIKDFVEHPDMVEDLRRTQTRDRSRLTVFQAAVLYLEKLQHSLLHFSNIKHRTGMVTSFYPIIEQIKHYRIIQDHYIHQRLPNSYVTRCSIFYDFVRKLESSFDAETKTLQADVRLMERLKNFETAREFYDMENEICNGLHHTIVERGQRKVSAETTMQEVLVQNLLVGKGRSHSTALTPDKLYIVVIDAMERLNGAIVRARSNLLAKLMDIRNDLLSSRVHLHERIAAATATFTAVDITDAERAGEETQAIISTTGKEVDRLHRQVEECVTGQLVLLEAHDIVGAANAIMTANEVDRFEDMERLHELFQNRCAAWKIIVDCESITQQTTAAKLANNNIGDINSKFVRLVQHFEKLSSELDDRKVVKFIRRLLRETRPKVELVSYLSSKALRPRHWTWIGKNVFRPCKLDIKLSGRQSEFVTVLDVKGREPVGLGNINRLAANEVISR